MVADYALEVQDIQKAFFSNQVLKGISFGVQKGEVLGLLGSNGAGKSTLMKIINGVYENDSGRILVNGQPVIIKSPKDARRHGIAMVYQEFSLVPTMTVTQNLFLQTEPKTGVFIRDKEAQLRTRESLNEFGIDIDPNAEVGSLSVGNQQLVEIVKALQQKPSILILDEPTASLTSKEVSLLFAFIRRLKQENIAIFFISHHMQEIMQICDRAVILRNGVVELNDITENLSVGRMVQAMVGKDISTEYLPPNAQVEKKALLKIENLRYKQRVNGVSLTVHAGEIVGLAGLMGSGRTEILECVFGVKKPDGGSIALEGQLMPRSKPWQLIKNGVYLVPENRHRSGIVNIHSIYTNMMLPIWPKLKGKALINDKAARKTADEMRQQLDIVSSNIDQELQRLSGGNQQKVVFAKSLLTQPRVLLLDEPSTGIDVEAKASIAGLVRKLADAGNGILIASSEMEELVRLCDRILVLKNGEIISELHRKDDEITQEALEKAIQA